ncbi:hypothetical protein C8J57DRAFT_1249958 [Mycena rebaudengoi]|nr:hypothetical protein C8J57DRAFT_1249958 [Mycena rebaudengoi]
MGNCIPNAQFCTGAPCCAGLFCGLTSRTRRPAVPVSPPDALSASTSRAVPGSGTDFSIDCCFGDCPVTFSLGSVVDFRKTAENNPAESVAQRRDCPFRNQQALVKINNAWLLPVASVTSLISNEERVMKRDARFPQKHPTQILPILAARLFLYDMFGIDYDIPT